MSRSSKQSKAHNSSVAVASRTVVAALVPRRGLSGEFGDKRRQAETFPIVDYSDTLGGAVVACGPIGENRANRIDPPQPTRTVVWQACLLLSSTLLQPFRLSAFQPTAYARAPVCLLSSKAIVLFRLCCARPTDFLPPCCFSAPALQFHPPSSPCFRSH